MARLKSSCLFILISTFLLSSTISADDHGGTSLLTIEEIMMGDHRSPANIARNQFRNPVETLEFFGLEITHKAKYFFHQTENVHSAFSSHNH